jgi:hypothetical protein
MSEMTNTTAFLRAEGAAMFIAATAIYFANHYSWILYLVLLFSFDISMLGYAINSRIGALTYNIGHSAIIPSLLAGLYAIHHSDALLGFICLWFAHIGFDRMLGYGLKLNTGFRHTHLGTIGK